MKTLRTGIKTQIKNGRIHVYDKQEQKQLKRERQERNTLIIIIALSLVSVILNFYLSCK